MFETTGPSPLQEIDHSLLKDCSIELYIKRDDQIDEHISGNKWRKLKYNLIEASEKGYNKILTFGGAYSNHIAATAYACQRHGFGSIGIIRGDELNVESNSTLATAHQCGMEMIFTSRSDYKRREDAAWVKHIGEKYQAFVVPEGGSNLQAIEGIKELIHEVSMDYDYMICPVGSGGTLAGLVHGSEGDKKILGISCLKGGDYLEKVIQSFGPYSTAWQLINDYHFGGYAKFNSQLIEFINVFKKMTGIPLDPVYTGKMMYGVFDLIKKGKFSDNSRIICVHTGGLQGIEGFNKKHNHLIEV